ncbi:MAG: M23 family metallopeptidase [Lachnospiraceae bacterium]|nr:M23 family metallopeptidase [Lachnospiraceae bacterium]
MLKSKSFYVSLACVLCAVAVVGLTSAAINSDKNNAPEKEKSYLGDDNNTDKNEEVLDISGQIGNDMVKNEEDEATTDTGNDEKSQSVWQNNIDGNNSETYNNSDGQAKDDKKDGEDDSSKSEKNEIKQDDSSKENGKTQTKKPDSKKEELVFNEESGLVWPVEGEVIMDFSGDSMVYYKTLGQFMTSDKILIGAAVGDRVKACATGTVTDITTTRETGKTLTLSIGSGYSVVYGELDNITVKKGEKIKVGQVIGTVSTPSGYYSKEGTNLYFKVMEDNEPVNPMYLLK